MKDTIPIRIVAALLVNPKGETRHQTIDDRRKRKEDTTPLTIEWIFNQQRKYEYESLRCIALQKKRLEFFHFYCDTHGKYPTPDKIKQITLQKENDDKTKTII